MTNTTTIKCRKLNRILTNVRGLEWKKSKLENLNEFWSKLEGIICNLSYNRLLELFKINSETFGHRFLIRILF